MKMIKRLLALVAALALCCGCALAEQLPTDVLATVNGTPILRENFDAYLANVTSYYAYYGYDVTSAENVAYLQYLTLDTLVQMALMDQKIAEMGVTLTAEERAAAEQEGRDLWVEDVSSAMASYYGVTDASSEADRAAALVQVLSQLEALGYSEESYVEESVENALYIKLEGVMVEGATVPEGEVERRYSQLVDADRTRYEQDAAAYESTLQMNDFALLYGLTEYYTEIWYIPQGYRSMVHILLPVDDALMSDWADLQATFEEQQGALEEGGEITGEEVTEQEVENARLAALASAQPQVTEITDRLAAGESFAELIPLYTTDMTMNDPEEIALGFPVHMDSILCPTGYRDAAFTLEQPGDVSEPFVADGGVYILCYVGDVQGGPVPLSDEMHASLHAALLQNAQQEKYHETMQAWVAAAQIVYSEEAQTFMNGH